MNEVKACKHPIFGYKRIFVKSLPILEKIQDER